MLCSTGGRDYMDKTPTKKQIGTPKEPFTLEADVTKINGKPFFNDDILDAPEAFWGDSLDTVEPHPDADDLAPEEGTGDKYGIYELSILTGISQHRIRNGDLTPAEVRILQDTQQL